MAETPDADDGVQNPDAEIQQAEEDLDILLDGLDAEVEEKISEGAEGAETGETEQAADMDTPEAGVESSAGLESPPAPFTPSNASAIWSNLSETRQSVSLVLGHTVVPLSYITEWSEGSLIELDKVSGEAIDVLVNGRLIARGEVIVVAENFGVRIVEIVQGA